MASTRYQFDHFVLDPANRQLRRGDDEVELNSRYFDALALLVREQGQLISKDRFLEEVWRGVPVTDEALTQCIKTLRKQLGDDAVSPRFIETVPKHGYRFIAAVQTEATTPPTATRSPALRQFLLLGGAGVIGGGVAGVCAGLFYGFGGVSDSLQPGIGAGSILLVLVCVSVLIGVLAGAGVGFGMAAASFARDRFWRWSILGGALGGLIIGGAVKLVGLDTFTVFMGQSPGPITGAPEGALLGGAVALGGWLGTRGVASLKRSIIAAGLTGAAAGVTISLLGGRLMGGSLDQLTRRFPNSRLELDQIGAIFGEHGFGPISQTVTGGLEGALFGVCMIGALMLARQRLTER